MPYGSRYVLHVMCMQQTHLLLDIHMRHATKTPAQHPLCLRVTRYTINTCMHDGILCSLHARVTRSKADAPAPPCSIAASLWSMARWKNGTLCLFGGVFPQPVNIKQSCFEVRHGPTWTHNMADHRVIGLTVFVVENAGPICMFFKPPAFGGACRSSSKSLSCAAQCTRSRSTRARIDADVLRGRMDGTL